MSLRTYYIHVLDGMEAGEPHGWLTRDEDGVRVTRPVVAMTRPGDGGVSVRASSPGDAVRRYIAEASA